MNVQPDYFDSLYRSSDDPYSVRTRWYERRKRAILMAALPQARYRRAYEPACGIGELTIDLARRCDQVLASDANDRAVDLARVRLLSFGNVQIEVQRLPGDWPPRSEQFDLIVLSEVGYFLSPTAWRDVVDRCATSLAPTGTLVACDWLPDFAERTMPTSALHEVVSSLGMESLLRHVEADFALEVWSGDRRSVAEHESVR
ncbi:SAM-dependent methyltransferase [soil metagenome]